MKPTILLFLFFILITFFHANAEENKTTETYLEEYKQKLKEFYQPPNCFLLSFRTNLNIPQYGQQNAEGSVRADNVNQRIRVILIEPTLGLTISWITVIDKIAYLSHPNKEGVLKLPLKDVSLGSVVNNQIQIPFALFQDILFGKLPTELFQTQDWKFENQQWIVQYTQNGDVITFYFRNEDPLRLEKVIYQKPQDSYYAIVNFVDKFYETKYPKQLKIQTFQNKTALESMTINFYKYIDTTKCKNEHFPVK
ncbi:MAG: hypothetical protein NZ853_09750 [Leptospiraceae bacterium]|nr:hypothetical protein [Leptospiraceae bacterium]MDW7976979.1 hypothetical protein [Leptospiraceae bacterium]